MPKKRYSYSIFSSLCLLFVLGCQSDPVETDRNTDPLQLISVSADQRTLRLDELNEGVTTQATFSLRFSSALDSISIAEGLQLIKESDRSIASFAYELQDQNRRLNLQLKAALEANVVYELAITPDLKGEAGQTFEGVNFRFLTEQAPLRLLSARINNQPITNSRTPTGVDPTNLILSFAFSEEVALADFETALNITPAFDFTLSYGSQQNEIQLASTQTADYYRKHALFIRNSLHSTSEAPFSGFDASFVTGLDSSLKNPVLNDDALMDLVQAQTFTYFYDYAHPVSGMTRERLGSGELVTAGGSGFGMMGMIVGIERGFISRAEGIAHLQKMLDFLERADRFHGVWPHWMNGSSGTTIPFSARDDGADLVETAFLAQAMYTVRQYLDPQQGQEAAMIEQINSLLDGIEWSWFRRSNQNVLFWHWSPQFDWAMNMQISGYNEALIVYVLAAASTTYGIPAEVYHQGWARNGSIQNNRDFYGFRLPLGFDYGGPLFFAHYSFLGLDPRTLSDRYADYWQQNRQHTLINRQHAIVNPNRYVGYSDASWGFTASDDPTGYRVHEPTYDNGTISPTAALSSIPFTPDESLKAMHHFYEVLGDKLWGPHGFYDAFNPTEGWWAPSYLAIDQGPILLMIENHRSGLLWELFMSAPEVQQGLDKLEFTY